MQYPMQFSVNVHGVDTYPMHFFSEPQQIILVIGVSIYTYIRFLLSVCPQAFRRQ